MAQPRPPIDYISMGQLEALAEGLTHEQAWALFLLCRFYLRNGLLPFTQDRQMAAIVRMSLKRWLPMRSILALKFGPDWRQPVLDAVIADVKKRRGQKVTAAHARWGKLFMQKH